MSSNAMPVISNLQVVSLLRHKRCTARNVPVQRCCSTIHTQGNEIASRSQGPRSFKERPWEKVHKLSNFSRRDKDAFTRFRARSTRVETPTTAVTEESPQPQDKPATVEIVEDDIVALLGVHNDTQVGSWIQFEGGARGVLVWKREPLAFVCVVDNVAKVNVAELAKPLPEFAGVLVNEAVWGAVVAPLGHIGRIPSDAETPLDVDESQLVPLLPMHVDVASRKPLHKPLPTGITAVDVLTPIGRGQSMMLLSAQQSVLSQVSQCAVRALEGTGTRCVYAVAEAPGIQGTHTTQMVAALQGCPGREAAVVVSPPTPTPAQRYLTVCAAASLAEAVMLQGGDAVVVVDDFSAVEDMWQEIDKHWCSFMNNYTPPSSSEDWAEEENGAEQSGGVAGTSGDGGLEVEGEKKPKSQEMVEFGGTMMPVNVAEHRQFVASYIQRTAQLNDALGGGTLSMLGLAEGLPMSVQGSGVIGSNKSKGVDTTDPETLVAAYQNISEEQRAKLLAALKKKQQDEQEQAAGDSTSDCKVPTKTVEELMSLADGHVCFVRPSEDSDTFTVDVGASLARLGNAVQSPAMRRLNTTDLRLQMMQSDDELAFSGQASSEVSQTLASQAAVFRDLMIHGGTDPVPLASQVVAVRCANRGYAVQRSGASVSEGMGQLMNFLRNEHAALLDDIESSSDLSASAQASLDTALDAFFAGSQ